MFHLCPGRASTACALAMMPLGTQEGREAPIRPLNLLEPRTRQPLSRLLYQVTSRRLVGPIELCPRRVCQPQPDLVKLACRHEPPHKLLHILRLGRALRRRPLRCHVVGLYQHRSSSQQAAELLDDAHDAQQLAPVDRSASLGVGELELGLEPLPVHPRQLPCAPTTRVRTRNRRHRQLIGAPRYAVTFLQMHLPPS